jgi:hypothetical protein
MALSVQERRKRRRQMASEIRQYVTVQPGGVVEVRSPELAPGTRAEVIVIPQETGPLERRTLRSMIGSSRGCYATPEEAVAFLRKERDTWD